MAKTGNPAQPKAYQDTRFLQSKDARALRILAEYLEPLYRFQRNNVQDTIVFMGSARLKSETAAKAALAKAKRAGQQIEAAEMALRLSIYYETARELARRLTDWSKKLDREERRFVVCTGGGPGIMEAANRGASEANGLNIGLTISIPYEEFDNPHISRELHFYFHYFFMRKFWFVYLAKAVVLFPGGYGTLDELFEAATLRQTEKIRNFPIILMGTKYWSGLIDWLRERVLSEGKISPEDVFSLEVTDDPQRVLEIVEAVEHRQARRAV